MSEQDPGYDPDTLDPAADETDPAEPAQPQHQLFDHDDDGRFDALLTRFSSGAWTTLADADSDGAAETFLADLDGDGRADLHVERLPDGTYLVRADVTGDGVLDYEQRLDRRTLEAADPAVVQYLDAHFDPVRSEPEPEPVDLVHDGRLIGDPAGDAEHWFRQAQNGNCVPASIAQIVSEYSGVHFADEQQFVELANEHNLFTEGADGVPGMTPENALTLLEASGVPAELQVGTPADLVGYLDEGRRILLFVDSGEIWYGEAVEDNQLDHAVVLTGIDTERGVAILSDPGHPDGNQEEVPLDVFVDAWADSQYTMLVCDEPPAHERSGQLAQGEPVARSAVTPLSVLAPTPVERVTSFVVAHPWVLLPVALAAGRITTVRS